MLILEGYELYNILCFLGFESLEIRYMKGLKSFCMVMCIYVYKKDKKLFVV